jgi:hypothetical protein
MNSSLKARIARLGPARAVVPVASGSPANLVLSPVRPRAEIRTIPAAIELARRGVSLLKAKRAIEAMLDQGRAYVRLPRVEDTAALIRALGAQGIAAALAEPPAALA